MPNAKLNVRAIIHSRSWGTPLVFFILPLEAPTQPQLPGGPVSECGLIDTIVSQFAEHTGMKLEEGRLQVHQIVDSTRPDDGPITIVYGAFFPDDLVEHGGLHRHGSRVTSSGFYNLAKLDPGQFEPSTWKLLKPILESRVQTSVRSLIID